MRIDTEELIAKYRDDLFRIAFHVCQNKEDSDDAVQETFIQYHISVMEFQDEMHIKAWLIRVVINKAKDLRRSGLSLWYLTPMVFDRHANLKYKYGNRHFRAEGYYVSTVGLNEATIKKYI